MNSIKKYCVMSAIGIICVLFTGSNMRAGSFAVRGAAAQPLQRYVNDAVRAALNQFDRVRVQARVFRNTAANALPTRLFQQAQMPADCLNLLRPGMILGEQVMRNVRQAYQTYQTRFNALIETANERLRGMNTAQSRAQAAEQRAAALQQQVSGLESLVHELVAAQEELAVQASCGEECAAMRQRLTEAQQCLRNAGNFGNQMQRDYAALQQSYADAQADIAKQNSRLNHYAREVAQHKCMREEVQRLYQQERLRNQHLQQKISAHQRVVRQEAWAVQQQLQKQLDEAQQREARLKARVLEQAEQNKALQDAIQALQEDQPVAEPLQDPRINELQAELMQKDLEIASLRTQVQTLEAAIPTATAVSPALPLLPSCTAAIPAPPATVIPSAAPGISMNVQRGNSQSVISSVVPAAAAAVRSADSHSTDERSALLAAIRNGKKLRRVERPVQQGAQPEAGSLAAALDARFRQALPQDEDDTDDEDQDADWE